MSSLLSTIGGSDAEMANQLSHLAILRIVVGHLGEVSEKPWWPTQFTTQAGLEFSRQNFPRTWASAAVNGAVRAAQTFHDARIGKQGTRHLFRFDGGLERQIHAEILHADQDAVASLIADREAALQALRELVVQSVSAPQGPIQVGTLADELRKEAIADIAAHYLDGFERGEVVLPYLARRPE